MDKFRVLDLFSGIGGFSLGLERTGGFETVAFCEIENYPRRVLRKHWPGVPIYKDIRDLTGDRLKQDGIAVDVITGGFPCQDISLAGKGAGITGNQSGLWAEIARISGEIRPQYILLENVAALLGRGLERVLGDLAAIRYDAEWHCIPASALGAPHYRDRWWAISYPEGKQNRWLQFPWIPADFGASNKNFPNPDSKRGNGRTAEHRANGREITARSHSLSDYDRKLCIREPANRMAPHYRPDGRHYSAGGRGWATEPNMGRVANGVPNRVDRLKCLGNAVVPQIPELIGRSILADMNLTGRAGDE